MLTKTIYIEKSFVAGWEVGYLQSYLSEHSKGNIKIVNTYNDTISLEVTANTAATMAMIEQHLSKYV